MTTSASGRLSAAFAKGHPALVCFVTAGDGPTPAILDALVEGGADVIELGMPFTDWTFFSYSTANLISPFAAAVNMAFVPRTLYNDTQLHADDRIELIAPVTGG
jgi:hypothetical protein